jgi:putative nucleotidyltransferase with HDIG domain
VAQAESPQWHGLDVVTAEAGPVSPSARWLPAGDKARGSDATAVRSDRALTRYLPHVAVATLIVAGAPVAVVWLLRSAEVISSPWISLLLAMGLSTVLSSAGCAYWKRSKGAGDLLFSELLVWGWLQRWRAERQLANAVQLLGLMPTPRTQPSEGLPAGRQESLLRQVATALEAQDRYTRGHSDRVARYATSIARKMGLAAPEIRVIRAAALVHDIGKLRVPIEILDKPAKLTDAEFEVIKRHPADGAEMVASLLNHELTAIVRHHHERLDGKGYPDGLAGEEIPIGSRIIAVADTFDAITSVRAYRPSRAHKKALDIIAQESGRQLDGDAVRAFVRFYAGTKSVAVWTVLTSLLPRFFSWMTGEASAATITTGNVVATALATAAIGGAAIVPAGMVHASPVRSRVHQQTAAQLPDRAPLATSPSVAKPVGLGGTQGLGGTSLGSHQAASSARPTLGHGPQRGRQFAGASRPQVRSKLGRGGNKSAAAQGRRHAASPMTSTMAAAGSGVTTVAAPSQTAPPSATRPGSGHSNPLGSVAQNGSATRQSHSSSGHVPQGQGHSAAGESNHAQGNGATHAGSHRPAGSQGSARSQGPVAGQGNTGSQGSAGSQVNANGQTSGSGQNDAGSQANAGAQPSGGGQANAASQANAGAQASGGDHGNAPSEAEAKGQATAGGQGNASGH